MRDIRVWIGTEWAGRSAPFVAIGQRTNTRLNTSSLSICAYTRARGDAGSSMMMEAEDKSSGATAPQQPSKSRPRLSEQPVEGVAEAAWRIAAVQYTTYLSRVRETDPTQPAVSVQPRVHCDAGRV